VLSETRKRQPAPGRHHLGTPAAEATPPPIDALIAATARVHGLTVVTRNVKNFELAGIPVLDPFAG
jgi:toxin FitB